MLIGEVAKRSGVSARMLRHYDRLGLVSPTGRTSGGYREYAIADIRRLFTVESLRTLGLSLSDVKSALDEPDREPAALVSELIAHTRRRIAAQQRLLATLERVEEATPAQWPDVLSVIEALRALDSDSPSSRQQAVVGGRGVAGLPADALIAALLVEDDLNVAGALRWSLARAGEVDLSGLSVPLAAPDVSARLRALSVLTTVESDESTDLLRRLLADADSGVRGRAALAVAARGEPSAQAELVDMIVDGRSDVEAAEALGNLIRVGVPDVEVIGQFRRLLDGTADRGVRLRITQALAELGVDAAVELLKELTEDADTTVAGTARAIVGGGGE